jgi:ABC-type Mn2+/Zn2+ transport system permease subunit
VLIYDALIAPFTDFEFMRRALAAVIALSLGGAPIGVFLMLRRMSLVGDAMAHAILPGGPFTAYPVASALLAVGADFGATIAMVVSWTLIGYGRAVAWEIPIMGTDFTLWRIVISLPLPVLAGALGRFVYVRIYPKGEAE